VSGDLSIELSVAGAGTIQADFDNVRLTATPFIPNAPTIATARATGNKLILTGVGGIPNGSYVWQAATNLSPPVNWITNSTGVLDGSGVFSNAIPINPAQSPMFFRLRTP
jgi:hypothetical protein